MRITKQMKEEYRKIKESTRRKVKNTIKSYGYKYNDIERHVDKTTKEVTYEVVEKDIRKMMDIPSIDSFTSKKQFDEFIREQRKFTSGQSPHAKFSKVHPSAVAMTDYAKLVLENKHAKAERLRINERKRLEKLGLKESAEESMMMKKPTISEFRPIKLDFNMMWNKGDIERKLIGLTIKGSMEELAKRRATLKENFINALQFAFNSDVDELVQLIRMIPDDDFYVIYDHPNNKGKFDIRYIPSPQKSLHFNESIDQAVLDRQLGHIYDTIQDYWDGKMDDEAAFLIKNF